MLRLLCGWCVPRRDEPPETAEQPPPNAADAGEAWRVFEGERLPPQELPAPAAAWMPLGPEACLEQLRGGDALTERLRVLLDAWPGFAEAERVVVLEDPATWNAVQQAMDGRDRDAAERAVAIIARLHQDGVTAIGPNMLLEAPLSLALQRWAETGHLSGTGVAQILHLLVAGDQVEGVSALLPAVVARLRPTDAATSCQILVGLAEVLSKIEYVGAAFPYLASITPYLGHTDLRVRYAACTVCRALIDLESREVTESLIRSLFQHVCVGLKKGRTTENQELLALFARASQTSGWTPIRGNAATIASAAETLLLDRDQAPAAYRAALDAWTAIATQTGNTDLVRSRRRRAIAAIESVVQQCANDVEIRASLLRYLARDIACGGATDQLISAALRNVRAVLSDCNFLDAIPDALGVLEHTIDEVAQEDRIGLLAELRSALGEPLTSDDTRRLGERLVRRLARGIDDQDARARQREAIQTALDACWQRENPGSDDGFNMEWELTAELAALLPDATLEYLAQSTTWATPPEESRDAITWLPLYAPVFLGSHRMPQSFIGLLTAARSAQCGHPAQQGAYFSLAGVAVSARQPAPAAPPL